MSASTQSKRGEKTFTKFLRKLKKKPKSAERLAEQVLVTPGTIRHLGTKAAKLGLVEISKVGNAFHYALKAQDEAVAK